MPQLTSRIKLQPVGHRLCCDDARENSTRRGYGYRWQKARDAFLRKHPLCACKDCQLLPVPLPADVVDHVIPHRGNMALFWDRANWQPMNHICHNRKTAREDGGFGR